MKVFHCDHCGDLVFFENVECLHCKHKLAYLPDLGVVASLDPAGDDRFTTPVKRSEGRAYKLCENYSKHNVCNWGLPADDPNSLCVSCRLTHVIPDLNVTGNTASWAALEGAKRRLVYTLMNLGLPVKNKLEDPAHGLNFELLADVPGKPVLTGHDEGTIVINIAEADDAEREKRRLQMHEPYRTLLGHFRHEIGHYYWDLLIKDKKPLEGFRKLFGDERQDYSEALKKNYAEGPAKDWQERHVSSYASVHPWEDWAETWAHYLHIVDTVQTAADSGVTLRPKRAADPNLKATPDPLDASFDRIIDAWFPLTYVLNNLNRGMGLRDAYPFILPPPVIEKLRFIHNTIAAAG